MQIEKWSRESAELRALYPSAGKKKKSQQRSAYATDMTGRNPEDVSWKPRKDILVKRDSVVVIFVKSCWKAEYEY